MWSFDLMLTCLLILAVTLFLLTLYSIVQANANMFHIANSRFFSLKVLDTASAASLFVTLLGALLVRHQFAVGVLPRINYISTRSEKFNKQNVADGTWRVDIHNTGLGPAIINRAEYIVKFVDAKIISNNCTTKDLLKELTKINLVSDIDYWIGNISNGFSLSPKDSCLVFEIKTEHIEKLKRLDLVLYFQGQLGDRYRREIILMPQL